MQKYEFDKIGLLISRWSRLGPKRNLRAHVLVGLVIRRLPAADQQVVSTRAEEKSASPRPSWLGRSLAARC